MPAEDTSDDSVSRALMQQNLELRRRLEEEHAGYKRKLQQYQEGQQRQAELVQKLQGKVMQYKKKCSDVEAKLAAGNEREKQSSPSPIIGSTLGVSSTARTQSRLH